MAAVNSSYWQYANLANQLAITTPGAALQSQNGQGIGGIMGAPGPLWNPYLEQQRQQERMRMEQMMMRAQQYQMQTQAAPMPPSKPAVIAPGDETPHKHLQRRVNKWLKGVELPLH